MKKILIALAALLTATVAQAQLLNFDGMPPYKLGLTAGLNAPSFSGAAYSYTTGFNAGIDIMLDASDIFDGTFARGVVKYSMMGATGPDHENICHYHENGKTYFTAHYVQIPIHYGYAWRIDRDWTVMAETGPYLGLGMGGTARPTGEFITGSHTFFRRHDVSRVDFGWGIQASMLFDQQWQLHVGYDWGFKNMNEIFLQNTGLNVGLTLYFEY